MLNRFAGTPGAAITAAASAAGGDAFSQMNPTTPTGVLTFSNELVNPFTGGTVAKVVADATTAAEARWNTADAVAGASQVVYWATGVPTTAPSDDQAIRGTRQNAGIRHHIGGQVRVLNLGTEIGTTANWPGITGEWVVRDLVVVEGADATSGTVKARLRRLADLTTVVASYASATRDAGIVGVDVINSFRFGKLTAGAVLPAMYLAQVQAVAGATDWLPDPGTNVIPVASLTANVTGPVEPGTTVTLTLADSDPDGTITTRTLTQVAGPTAAPVGAGAARTVLAPYTLAGTTLAYAYTVVDDDGATSAPASVSIDVLPATERIVVMGGPTPVEVPGYLATA
ncbi:hypothetical protein [Cellulomonas oligotrophica]|uniref:Uncharacterized protein n=1 Tax=Cellulomonas oligotrophica TaxID=931536 RepID=A0A7Y9FI95_9CELL|nr:hypothetical protein [Cellulomonas oligotrophica]NYD87765.1 hypothetical protein [Cellulomonas oligotrophica]GIG33030.1 hypothetical protein Col01nite_21890 [Cellulomonas oligotrophica]